jgi:hypothetical protein
MADFVAFSRYLEWQRVLGNGSFRLQGVPRLLDKPETLKDTQGRAWEGEALVGRYLLMHPDLWKPGTSGTVSEADHLLNAALDSLDKYRLNATSLGWLWAAALCPRSSTPQATPATIRLQAYVAKWAPSIQHDIASVASSALAEQWEKVVDQGVMHSDVWESWNEVMSGWLLRGHLPLPPSPGHASPLAAVASRIASQSLVLFTAHSLSLRSYLNLLAPASGPGSSFCHATLMTLAEGVSSLPRYRRSPSNDTSHDNLSGLLAVQAFLRIQPASLGAAGQRRYEEVLNHLKVRAPDFLADASGFPFAQQKDAQHSFERLRHHVERAVLASSLDATTPSAPKVRL